MYECMYMNVNVILHHFIGRRPVYFLLDAVLHKIIILLDAVLYKFKFFVGCRSA